MKSLNSKKIKQKDLIVFDLDGTIAPSKSTMDNEMTELIINLLKLWYFLYKYCAR